uniref:Uncharacterized protein n=1 Tax=Triticum urartu TaxID=4572 RepID=A0A8R7PH65_TRIUA
MRGEEPLAPVVGRRERYREHRRVRGKDVGHGVQSAAPWVTQVEAVEVELDEHLRLIHVLVVRGGRGLVDAEHRMDDPATRRVELADHHVEGGGGRAAVAVLVHAPLGLPGRGRANLGLVLVVAEGVAVGGAAEQPGLAAEAVRAGPGPAPPALALRAAHEEEPLGPAVGRRVHGGEEAGVRAVDVGVVDLPGQAVAEQGAAQGQVPGDDGVRGRVERFVGGGVDGVRRRGARRRGPGRLARVGRRPGQDDPAVVGLLLQVAEGGGGRRGGLRRRLLPGRRGFKGGPVHVCVPHATVPRDGSVDPPRVH